MPSKTRPESAASAAPARSWRKASGGPAAGPAASTASAPAGSNGGAARVLPAAAISSRAPSVGRANQALTSAAPEETGEQPGPARLHLFAQRQPAAPPGADDARG